MALDSEWEKWAMHSRERMIAAMVGLQVAEASLSLAISAELAAKRNREDAEAMATRARKQFNEAGRQVRNSVPDAKGEENLIDDAKGTVNDYLRKIGLPKI